MEIKLPQKVKDILDVIEANGYEAYVVGGCVRDSILGREPGDWDITTSARPEEIKALFGGIAEVLADKTIKIGGVKGYCKSMGIIADETLDSKLDAQREWFTENAALSVL